MGLLKTIVELRIKARLNSINDIETLVSIVRKIEEEHNCSCTLIEIETG